MVTTKDRFDYLQLNKTKNQSTTSSSCLVGNFLDSNQVSVSRFLDHPVKQDIQDTIARHATAPPPSCWGPNIKNRPKFSLVPNNHSARFIIFLFFSLSTWVIRNYTLIHFTTSLLRRSTYTFIWFSEFLPPFIIFGEKFPPTLSFEDQKY